MKLLLLLVMVTVCAAAPQDLTGKTFTFLQETNTDHVRLNISPQDLSALTICHRSITDLRRDHTLFSMSTLSNVNEILIYWEENSNELQPHFNGQHVPFHWWDYKPNTWHSICTTWDTATRQTQMWFDGKPFVKKISRTGSRITGSTITVLGQDQDNYGGGFDAKQSFVGMMSDVHMWNRVLSPCEIQNYMDDINFPPGNVINWKALDYQIIGNILLEDQPICT